MAQQGTQLDPTPAASGEFGLVGNDLPPSEELEIEDVALEGDPDPDAEGEDAGDSQQAEGEDDDEDDDKAKAKAKESGKDEDEGDDDIDFAQAALDLEPEEVQALLDGLAKRDDFGKFEMTIRHDGEDRRESLENVRRNASGYLGSEKVSELSRANKEKEAELEQRAAELEQRDAVYMEHLGNPAKFVEFVEMFGEKPLDYITALHEATAKIVERAAEDPDRYEDRLESRRLRRMLEQQRGGGAANRPKAKEGGDLSEAEEKVIQRIERERHDLVVSMGFDVQDVAAAFKAQGFPDNFGKFLADYAKKHGGKGKPPESEKDKTKKKPSLRRRAFARGRGRDRSGGGGSSDGSMVKDIEHALRKAGVPK